MPCVCLIQLELLPWRDTQSRQSCRSVVHGTVGSVLVNLLPNLSLKPHHEYSLRQHYDSDNECRSSTIRSSLSQGHKSMNEGEGEKENGLDEASYESAWKQTSHSVLVNFDFTVGKVTEGFVHSATRSVNDNKSSSTNRENTERNN